MATIFDGRNIFDSRVVDERITALEALEAAAKAHPDPGYSDTEHERATGLAWSADGEREYYPNAEYGDDEEEELYQLREFKSDVSHPSWDSGMGFILDSFFEEYAQQTAEDIGDISRGSSVEPFVNWSNYADSLKMDYKQIDLADETYWYRS